MEREFMITTNNEVERGFDINPPITQPNCYRRAVNNKSIWKKKEFEKNYVDLLISKINISKVPVFGVFSEVRLPSSK